MSLHRQRIMVIRESIERVVNLLSRRSIKVTQRGMQAAVLYNKDGSIAEVNLPYIPDDASEEFVSAVQGFLDHEVGHILFSDPKLLWEGKHAGPQVYSMHNMLEDTFIEREVSREFAGSASNLNQVRGFFLEKMIKGPVNKALAMGDINGAIAKMMVVQVRAWAGQTQCLDYLRDNPEHAELMKEFTEVVGDLAELIPKCKSTADTLTLSKRIVTRMVEHERAKREKAEAERKKREEEEKRKEEEREAKRDEPKLKPEDAEKTGESGEGEPDEADPGEPDEADPGEPGDSPESADSDKGEDDAPEGAPEEPDEGDEGDEGDKTDEGGEPDGDDEPDEGEPEGDDPEEGDPEEGDGGDEADEGPGAGASAGADEGDDSGEGSKPTDELTPGTALTEALGEVEDFDGEVAKALADEARKEMTSADYRTFSKEWDEVEPAPAGKLDGVSFMDAQVRSMVGVMSKRLERALAAQSRVGFNPGQRRGRINQPSLFKAAVGDDRLFRQKYERHSRRTAVSLLIDCSGSMYAEDRIATAGKAAYALSTTLERLRITHEVIGFTTRRSGWAASEMSRRMSEERAKVAGSGGMMYSRSQPIYMPVFKGFGERLTSEAKARIVALTEMPRWLAENPDGECLQIAADRLLAQKLVERHIMIVLSDGAPACPPGWGLSAHLKKVVKDLSARMEIVGIGIQTTTVREYYPKHVVLNNVEDLPGEVVQQLTKLLLEP